MKHFLEQHFTKKVDYNLLYSSAVTEFESMGSFPSNPQLAAMRHKFSRIKHNRHFLFYSLLFWVHSNHLINLSQTDIICIHSLLRERNERARDVPWAQGTRLQSN